MVDRVSVLSNISLIFLLWISTLSAFAQDAAEPWETFWIHWRGYDNRIDFQMGTRSTEKTLCDPDGFFRCDRKNGKLLYPHHTDSDLLEWIKKQLASSTEKLHLIISFNTHGLEGEFNNQYCSDSYKHEPILKELFKFTRKHRDPTKIKFTFLVRACHSGSFADSIKNTVNEGSFKNGIDGRTFEFKIDVLASSPKDRSSYGASHHGGIFDWFLFDTSQTIPFEEKEPGLPDVSKLFIPMTQFEGYRKHPSKRGRNRHTVWSSHQKYDNFESSEIESAALSILKNYPTNELELDVVMSLKTYDVLRDPELEAWIVQRYMETRLSYYFKLIEKFKNRNFKPYFELFREADGTFGKYSSEVKLTAITSLLKKGWFDYFFLKKYIASIPRVNHHKVRKLLSAYQKELLAETFADADPTKLDQEGRERAARLREVIEENMRKKHGKEFFELCLEKGGSVSLFANLKGCFCFDVKIDPKTHECVAGIVSAI